MVDGEESNSSRPSLKSQLSGSPHVKRPVARSASGQLQAAAFASRYVLVRLQVNIDGGQSSVLAAEGVDSDQLKCLPVCLRMGQSYLLAASSRIHMVHCRGVQLQLARGCRCWYIMLFRDPHWVPEQQLEICWRSSEHKHTVAALALQQSLISSQK